MENQALSPAAQEAMQSFTTIGTPSTVHIVEPKPYVSISQEGVVAINWQVVEDLAAKFTVQGSDTNVGFCYILLAVREYFTELSTPKTQDETSV